MANINVRSPYFINEAFQTASPSDETKMRLYLKVYNGTQQSLFTDNSTADYTLSSSYVSPQQDATFEISDIVAGFMNIDFDGTYSTEINWVDWKVYEVDGGTETLRSSGQDVAYYAYGYFTDGPNPDNYTGISNGVYNFIPDSDELDQPSWTINSGVTIGTIASGDSYNRACQVTQSSSTSVDVSANLLDSLPIGQEVTISCWVNFTNAGGASTRDFQLGYYDGGSGVNAVTESITVNTGWQFLSHTFTVNDSHVATPRIRFNGFGNGSAGDVYRIWNCACYLGQPRQEQMSTYGVPGVMKTNKRNIKLSVNEIYKPENETFNIGITSDEGFASNDGIIKAYYENGSEIINFATTIVNNTGDSESVVNYLKVPVNAATVRLQYYGNAEYLYQHNQYYIPVKTICEPKYTPRKITFVNKYGTLEDLWFFKASRKSMTTESETFRGNIVNNGSYSIHKHVYKTLNKSARTSMTINSGWYPESHNEAFKQLLLSEQVWINLNGETLPVVIKTNQLELKESVNSKLISYTIELDFAFDEVNNIR